MANFFWRIHALAVLVLMCTIFASPAARAHGIIGDRFFPATLVTDDPFAADELALPTLTVLRHKDGSGAAIDETDATFEWSKSILPGFAIAIGGGYVDARPASGGPASTGFGNFEVKPLVELFRSPEHEFIATGGVNIEIGGSGARAVADPFTTVTPEVLFGKGFGDLPNSMALLRPFAVTGTLGYAIPATSAAPRTIQWGGAVEYSLLYLQNNVRDPGFGKFVAHLTPVVEFALSSPADGGTTGTISPGILWSGQYEQFGIEAIVPVNKATSGNAGAIVQLHFYIDDIFPATLGRPIFGGRP